MKKKTHAQIQRLMTMKSDQIIRIELNHGKCTFHCPEDQLS